MRVRVRCCPCNCCCSWAAFGCSSLPHLDCASLFRALPSLLPRSSCLQSEGLYTSEVDTASLANQGLGMGLLGGAADRDGVSALESGAQPQANGARGVPERGSGAPPGAAGAAVTAHSGGGQAGRAELADAKKGSLLPQAGRSPTGAASPPPQQEQKQVGGEGGSGSGGGSGQPLSQPQLLSGSGPQQRQRQQQQLLSQLGSGQLGSAGSLLAGLMQGSVHHSGAELPSGGVAPDAAAAVAAVPPAAVAAALQQVLQQSGSGMLQQQQLAALLGGQGMAAALQLPASATPTALNGLGTSPAVTGGMRQQDVQPPPPGTQQQQQQQQGADGGTGGAPLPQNGSLADIAAAAQQAGEEDEMDEDTEDEQPFLRPAPGAAQKYGQGNRILTYDDLAAQVRAALRLYSLGPGWRLHASCKHPLWAEAGTA